MQDTHFLDQQGDFENTFREHPVRQTGDWTTLRRLASTKKLDLIVFYNSNDEFEGFELSWQTLGIPHCLNWSKKTKLRFTEISEFGRLYSTDILVANGSLDKVKLAKEFKEASIHLANEIREKVLISINDFEYRPIKSMKHDKEMFKRWND